MEKMRDAESGTFIVPANSFVNLAFTGEFVRSLSSTNNLEISFNHGAKAYFDAGISRRVSSDIAEFDSFQLYNETGADITTTVAWGYGDIEDNRLSLTGDVSIKNAVAPNDVLAVNNNYFTDLQRIRDSARENIMTIGQFDIAPKTNLVGASYASVTGATTTVVTAAANTSGIILRVCQISGQMGNNSAYIRVGGNDVLSVLNLGSTSPYPTDQLIKDLLIPSGADLVISSSGALFTKVIYEVL